MTMTSRYAIAGDRIGKPGWDVGTAVVHRRDTLISMRLTLFAALSLVAVGGVMSPPQTERPAAANMTLTAVDGITVGHFTLTTRPTGCTVILARDGTVGSGDVRGGAPGTRETDLLNPANDVQIVNAIVLSGGSAYGLDAATGTMKWLDERHIGYPVGAAGVVPIVPSAILFDLGFGGDPKIRPGADCGYRAAEGATTAPVQEGNVGAGAGATIGKTAGVVAEGNAGPMKAGIGSSAIR